MFYLVQANQSFSDHLTNTFTFSFTHSSFGAHLESAPSSMSASSWIHTRRKWVYTQTQIEREIEIWMKEWINPFIAQENPLKTSLENIKRIGFYLQLKTPKLRKEMRKSKYTWSGCNYLHGCCSLYLENEISLYLKCKKKPLI